MNNDDSWGNGEIVGRAFPELPGSNMLSVSLLCLCLIPPPSLPPHASWSNGNPRLAQKQSCAQRPALCSISSSYIHPKNVDIPPHPCSTCWVSVILAHTHINNNIQCPDCWCVACVWMSFILKTDRPKPQLPLSSSKINCHDSCYVTPVFSLLLLSDLP